MQVVRTQVGDRYVVEEMRRRGYNFGGEQSGHLVFLDHATTGDGTLAALQLLAVMLPEEEAALASWPPSSSRSPQTLLNVGGAGAARRWTSCPTVQQAIAAVEAQPGPGRPGAGALLRHRGQGARPGRGARPGPAHADAHRRRANRPNALSAVLG